VTQKLMAKKPADRYGTPAELAEALQALVQAGHVPGDAAEAPRREVGRLAGHTAGGCCVAYCRGGAWLVSGGQDRTWRVWDLASGALLREFPSPAQEVRAVAVLPDDRAAAVACGAGVRVLDLESGRELLRCVGHSDTVRCVAVSPDGARAASGAD